MVVRPYPKVRGAGHALAPLSGVPLTARTSLAAVAGVLPLAAQPAFAGQRAARPKIDPALHESLRRVISFDAIVHANIVWGTSLTSGRPGAL